MLRELVETVRREPHITTAGLLERFRTHEEGRHLGRLASTEMPPDEEFDPAPELAECLRRLALDGNREKINFLIEKQKHSSLSDAEKWQLRELGKKTAASRENNG